MIHTLFKLSDKSTAVPSNGKKYFAAVSRQDNATSFHQVKEQDLIDANFKKPNAYKNFKCVDHNKFFELNCYEKNSVNQHHWRANIARPADDIDLPTPSTADPPVAGLQASGILDAADPQPTSRISAAHQVVVDALRAIQQQNISDRFDDNQDEDSCYTDRRSFGRYNSEVGDDFAACSLEDCGYCGRCHY